MSAPGCHFRRVSCKTCASSGRLPVQTPRAVSGQRPALASRHARRLAAFEPQFAPRPIEVYRSLSLALHNETTWPRWGGRDGGLHVLCWRNEKRGILRARFRHSSTCRWTSHTAEFSAVFSVDVDTIDVAHSIVRLICAAPQTGEQMDYIVL